MTALAEGSKKENHHRDHIAADPERPIVEQVHYPAPWIAASRAALRSGRAVGHVDLPSTAAQRIRTG